MSDFDQSHSPEFKEQPADNQEYLTNNSEQSSDEDLEQKQTRLQNELGSKVLSLVNFESKYKNIVESSFNKAKNEHEKLPGKNNERRNYVYLSRLNFLIKKYGDYLEQRLWQASASKVIINPEDITDGYWKQQEQILRDEGQGRSLSDYEKNYLTENIIKDQERTIAPWINYLSDKDCPYPIWFKVYAFDGLSKMGLYNDKTKEFEKRNKHTIGRFPNLNPEALTKVYSHINDFFNQDSSNWFKKHPEDEKLNVLVKSGNFNKLYSKELLETKVIMKTPERTEDIHGDWFEYKLGDEEQISKLAEGTRWCIADPHMARKYLSKDVLDNDYNNYEDNYEGDNKARFFIFRLKTDRSKDNYADNGSASIRLDSNGNVAEVSGLKDEQSIEDALIPIVQEKVATLPGSEEYAQKFADKQELIRLDRKMQNNQDLTKEELEFIYEINRDIVTLDTYNDDDPRIQELREKYNLKYILDHNIAIDLNKLAQKISDRDIIENLDFLMDHNIDINTLVINNLEHGYDIIKSLDALVAHGVDININKIVDNMDSYDIAKTLDILINHDANIDMDKIVIYMSSSDIVKKFDTFIAHGVDINILVKNMNPHDIFENLDTLIAHGADANILVKKMNPSDIARTLDILINYGANIDMDNLAKRLNCMTAIATLDTLIAHGANIDIITNNMSSEEIAENLDTLMAHGANIDMDKIVYDITPHSIARNFDALITHDADVDFWLRI